MFKDIIRRCREKKDYTQSNIAEVLEISRVAYAKLEEGRTLPRLDTAIKISKLYGVSLDELFGYEIKNTRL